MLAFLALLLAAPALAEDEDYYYSSVTPAENWWEPGSGVLLPGFSEYADGNGNLGLVNKAGWIITQDHPFFTALGPNGRACVSCHQPAQGMSLAAASLAQRWDASGGKDPVFAVLDGADCPTLPAAEKQSHSLLLTRGLIRVAVTPPKGAQFTIAVVKDPTGCNQGPALSVYRRPRPVGNFPAAGDCGGAARGGLMADGREASLTSQAVSAGLTHLEMKAAPDPAQLRAITDFECQVFVAQNSAGEAELARHGDPSGLGPERLSEIASFLKSAPVFPSLAAWKRAPDWDAGALRRSVGRGAEIFSQRRFAISGAFGVNRNGRPMLGTCATCHDVPVTGAASARWIDTGSTNQPWAMASPQLPLFKVTCKASAPTHPFLGREIYTQDPGRALVTGKCADVGAIGVQQLRGLAARAPYFSNGAAATLGDVVDFYDRRFAAHFTAREKLDLVNFLGVL